MGLALTTATNPLATCRQSMWPVALVAALFWFAAPERGAFAEEPSAPATAAATSEKEPATDSPAGAKWRALLNGTDLTNWEVTGYGGEGEVLVEDGAVLLRQGAELTGINWTGEPLPTINYELRLKARKLQGNDFFCGIVFPVNKDHCSFVLGGWGGGVVGLSSIDGIYAAENDTATYQSFEKNRWYEVRLRVSEHRIEAWIDEKQVVNLKTKGRKIGVHPSVAVAKPLGVCAFVTESSLKDLELRELTPEEVASSEHAPKDDE